MLAVFLFVGCGLVLKTLATSLIFTEGKSTHSERSRVTSSSCQRPLSRVIHQLHFDQKVDKHFKCFLLVVAARSFH